MCGPDERAKRKQPAGAVGLGHSIGLMVTFARHAEGRLRPRAVGVVGGHRRLDRPALNYRGRDES